MSKKEKVPVPKEVKESAIKFGTKLGLEIESHQPLLFRIGNKEKKFGE